jgi:hypothetical protein
MIVSPMSIQAFWVPRIRMSRLPARSRRRCDSPNTSSQIAKICVARYAWYPHQPVPVSAPLATAQWQPG